MFKGLLNQKKNKRNKGFTLIEVIVVLVIIGILLAIAVPSIMGYVDQAHDAKDDVSVGYLNKGTEAYKIRLYASNSLKEDVFDGLGSEKDFQDALLKARMIDGYLTSYKDDNNYFYWDKKEQIWKKEPGTGGDSGDGTGGEVEPTEQKPIKNVMPKGLLTDQFAADGKVPEEYNWLIVIKEGGYIKYDGNVYKRILGDSGRGTKPDLNSKGEWKRVDTTEYIVNNYQPGDIVLQDGKYYMAFVAHDEIGAGNIYTRESKSSVVGHPYFVEVKKLSSGIWVEA